MLDHYRNLTRLSPEAQDYFLLMSLAPADGMAADLQQLERAWRGGDLAFLAPRSAGAYSGNPELRTALLNGRNQSWMPSLRRLTDSSRPVLVVVGCLHLCGPGSLPALMQARGYTVQPYFGEPASPIAPTAAAPPPAPSSAVRQLRALVSSERAPDVLRGRIPGERSSPP